MDCFSFFYFWETLFLDCDENVFLSFKSRGLSRSQMDFLFNRYIVFSYIPSDSLLNYSMYSMTSTYAARLCKKFHNFHKEIVERIYQSNAIFFGQR